ncbi:phosphoribosyl anthranilate isomerase [Legionella busanensis]|uniref:N-(5'-phosphoribosyl)anthranilate isomerase n=1 Tax=Legionella busanensis TaxID=190655 RepID=A0A378JKK8_9GAMM|nr:phosphoribosylanthranilate isomerase [Legionella busanensis]STX51617.1 phosphoribosyl anthranilate isomerase [Legionella busanensis]
MQSYKTRIKMCGMTRQEDIAHALSLGVDAIGLIFYKGSKRAISVDDAKRLITPLPLFINIVAVFVNPSVEEVWQVIHELPVQWLQFHGNESESFCSQFNLPYIKALPVKNKDEVSKMMSLYPQASAFLLDTPSQHDYGGTGIIFDWNNIPEACLKPIILAGGLTTANIQEAINKVSPAAIDVCSGIEQSPGIKDHYKMVQFVKALRENYE